MTKLAVVKTGGKQYLVKENDQLVVEHLGGKTNDKLALETLAVLDIDKNEGEVGMPLLK